MPLDLEGVQGQIIMVGQYVLPAIHFLTWPIMLIRDGKGESIYKNTNTLFNNSRGKILTGGGGGNDHNAGGGGGGNYTAGGQGGNGYNNCVAFPGGGLGGISLSASISGSRVFMGGAGGGG
jgi:hypothetical protein